MVNISKIASTVCKTGASQVKTSETNVNTLSELLAGAKSKLTPELKEIKMPKEKSLIGKMIDKVLYGLRTLFGNPKTGTVQHIAQPKITLKPEEVNWEMLARTDYKRFVKETEELAKTGKQIVFDTQSGKASIIEAKTFEEAWQKHLAQGGQ